MKNDNYRYLVDLWTTTIINKLYSIRRYFSDIDEVALVCIGGLVTFALSVLICLPVTFGLDTTIENITKTEKIVRVDYLFSDKKDYKHLKMDCNSSGCVWRTKEESTTLEFLKIKMKNSKEQVYGK